MTPCLDEHLRQPGCTGVAQPGGSRCGSCARRRAAARRPSGGRRYDYGWQKAAKAAIAASPRCATCGTPGSPSNPLTGGHVVPRVMGGTQAQGIVAQCRNCNSADGGRLGGQRRG